MLPAVESTEGVNLVWIYSRRRHSRVTHSTMLLLNFGDQKTLELCVSFPFLSLYLSVSLLFSSTFAISVFESSLIQILGTILYSRSDLLSFQVNTLKLKGRIFFFFNIMVLNDEVKSLPSLFPPLYYLTLFLPPHFWQLFLRGPHRDT